MFDKIRKLTPLLFAGLLFFVTVPLSAGTAEEIIVTDYLNLGPLPLQHKLFAPSDDVKGWLEKQNIDLTQLTPGEGDNIAWLPGSTVEWVKISGELIDIPPTGAFPAINYSAFYIVTDRRQTVNIRIETPAPAALFVDGSFEAVNSQQGEDDTPNLLYTNSDLHTGKHVIIVKSLKTANGNDALWNIRSTVTPEDGFPAETITLSTDPGRTFSEYGYYWDIDDFASPVVSPDGKLCAFERKFKDNVTLKTHTTIEIRKLKDGELFRNIEQGSSVSRPSFSADGQHLYFRTSRDGTILWKYNLANGEAKKVFGPVKGLVKMIISPDEKFVYYTVDDDRNLRGTDDYKLMTTLEERLTDWYDKRTLHTASLEDGASHALSVTGDYAIDEFTLSSDGNALVFTRRIPISGRPYFKTEFWLLELTTGQNRLLQSLPIPFETRPLNLTLIPDTDYLVCTMASHFTGEEEVDGVLMNLSETDVWRLNMVSLEFVNLTGDKPAPTGEKGFTVDEHFGTGNSLFWNDKDKRLYFGAMVRGFNRLYSIDIENPADIQEIPLNGEYIKNFHLSENGRNAVYSNQALDQTKQLFTTNLRKNKPAMIFDPNPSLWERYTIGKVERFDFTDSLGELIDGWILYPPDFQPEKKYPCIVYYYAGVWMLDESFYYTYHFWAANGYVVYALSPVGSMAHGERFSAYHTNDWGTHATQDIIEGAGKLLEAKEFIDADKLGCYGGSYGGFTTMDLVTKTDMFACAVSMYGISNIASYWGGGIWGYTYGDIALARSYPWNRKDLFTNNSPLFNADKVNTPLLLLHGEDDVNVPALESDQMFTALKVLSQDAAYVRFPGEGHGIAGDKKNYIAHREMMLEWFDKYLKGQPQGWERRWKE